MKKDLIGTYDFVQTLYRKGVTNNEQLAQLLTMLKEISDARPTEISEDFKNLFEDLDISDDTLNDARTMMMMFLTKLAVTYKPTNSSEFPHKLLEIHYGNIVAMDEVYALFQNSLSKIDSNSYDEEHQKLFENYHNFFAPIMNVLKSKHYETQQKIDEWLNEIRY
jgi:Zn-dependent oligopeptidase